MRKTYNYYKRDGEHWFEWADGESKHVTKCSFHGCIQLGEEFDKFGYDLDSSCEFNEQHVNENSAVSQPSYEDGYFNSRWLKNK